MEQKKSSEKSTSVNPEPSCIAFAGTTRIAQGSIREVASKVKQHMDAHPDTTLLIFDDASSMPIELDLRGKLEDVLSRISPKATESEGTERPGPGRPKLGVVSREIGLLPRHWEWLATQPGGASVTLRKLVEEAKKANSVQDRVRISQNAAYKFMVAVAGNLPHFEEATRAFFAKNKALFETLTAAWPKDLRDHALNLGAEAFDLNA